VARKGLRGSLDGTHQHRLRINRRVGEIAPKIENGETGKLSERQKEGIVITKK